MADKEVDVLSVRQPRSKVKLAEYEQETSHLDSQAYAGHLLDNVADEVALEGLDGITFQALKLRLESRPNFEIEGFEDVASAVWNQVRRSKYFTFYLLPEPRPDLTDYSWDQYKDDRGNSYEPLHAPEDIYPYFPVEDKEKGIRGSCEHYAKRKDMSFMVRRISYLRATQLFGNRLVIVANQVLREAALLGANYRKYQNLSIIQYCIIERVGRARHSGEITRGKVSTACMKIPPKTQFYQRKLLLEKGLVIRQNASVKFIGAKCPAAVTVFHLPRFYKRIEAMSTLNLRIIIAALNNSEEKCIPVEAIVSKYGKHTLRTLQQQFSSVVDTIWHQLPVPAPELEPPEPEPDDNETSPKKPKKRRTVRAIRLKVTDLSVQSQLVKKALEKQTGGEEDGGESSGGGVEQEVSEAKVNLTSANTYSKTEILRPVNHFITVAESYFLYHMLIRAGTGGLTQADFSFFDLTPLEARSTSRNLIRINICKEGILKMYKQKAFTYTLTQFNKDGPKWHMELQEKLVSGHLELARFRELLGGKASRPKPSVAQQSNVASIPDEKSSSVVDTVEVKPLANLEAENDSKKSKKKSKSKQKSSNKVPLQPSDPSPTKGFKTPPVKRNPLPPPVKAPPVKRNPLPPPPPLSPLKMPSLCLVKSEEKSRSGPSRKKKKPISVVSIREIASPTSEELESTPLIVPATVTVSEPSRKTLAGIISTEPEGADMNEMGIDDYVDYEDLSETTETSHFKKERGEDQVDEEIRKRMKRQRVDWNDHDDLFVLLAYIATALFIPKYNFMKIFIFNSFQIRDLLLKKTHGTSNKTSAAIRRRVHFLFKYKSYFDRYLGLIGAAVRDEHLYETYIKMHLQPPQNKIYTNPPLEALEKVIDYLYKKLDNGHVLTTDTKTTVNELETILFMRQLKRSEFYWNALIFALFCPTGKTLDERTRFREMWRKVVTPEGEIEVVRSLEDEIQIGELEGEDNDGSDGLVEILEEVEEEKKTPEDYYLEYCYRLYKFLLKNLRIVFNNMLILGSVRNSKGFQLICFDYNLLMASSVGGPNLCLSVRECEDSSEIRLWAARCNILDYVFCGDSSRIHPKANVNKLPLEKAANLLTGGKMLLISKRTQLLCLSRSNVRQFKLGLASSSYDETLDFLNYIDEASNVDSLACISIGILYGIVELSDYFKSSINIIESIFTLNDEWAPVYDGISHEKEQLKETTKGRKRKASGDAGKRSGSPLLKRARLTREEEEDIEDLIDCFEDIENEMFIPTSQGNVGLEQGENYISSSMNALRLLRIRLNQAGVLMPTKQFTGFVEKDFFTINLPSLEFVFPKRGGLNHKIAGVSHVYLEEDMKELNKALVEPVYHQIGKDEEDSEVQYIERHLKKYCLLFELINLAGNVGVSGTFLESKFERKSLIKGLRYLLDSRLVFSVGIAQRRFVSYNNISDWVTPTRSSDGNVTGHVIIRPWITANGGLSWSTIIRLFTAILGQLQKPGVSFDELCECLMPTLSPVEVTVLIETFAKLKYLTVYRINEKDATMSSKHPKAKSDIEYYTDTLIDTENVYVAVSPYTTFLYAQLQHATQKKASRKTNVSMNSTEDKSTHERDLFRKKRRKGKKTESTSVSVDIGL